MGGYNTPDVTVKERRSKQVTKWRANSRSLLEHKDVGLYGSRMRNDSKNVCWLLRGKADVGQQMTSSDSHSMFVAHLLSALLVFRRLVLNVSIERHIRRRSAY